jgi:DNA-binding GntR family transcriptional regulator
MNPSQAERLRATIEAEILSFKLKPGDKLDEARLAEKYGTSRTPVREALRQLSANGLIEIRPHKGAIVAKIGIRELVELFEVIAELEGACGRFAAKACLQTDVKAIIVAQESCLHFAAANDIPSYRRANEEFHDAIYRASRNRSLIKLTIDFRNRVAPYRRLLFEQPNRLKTSAQEHNRIVDAIQEGQPDEADRLLQLHILHLGGELRRLITMVFPPEWEPTRVPELVP